METSSVDRIVTIAQIALSILFVTGYFIVLVLFMLGYAQIPSEQKDVFVSLITLLSTGVLSITYFWFQRARARGGAVPNEEGSKDV